MASKAHTRGSIRKRRRHRAERRIATQPTREAYNKMMQEQGHPGWTDRDYHPIDTRFDR